MFAEMFGVELAAILEASTEETNKAEKTSLEATKEVHKDVEIKVDEREKPAVPVSLFEVSSGCVRPIPLSRPEQNLLSEFLKNLQPIVYEHDISKENHEVKETKVEEEKQKKPERAVCPPKVPEKPVASGITFYSENLKGNINSEKRRSSNINGRETTPSTNEQGNNNKEKESRSASCAESRLNVNSVNKKSTNEQDDLDARLAKKIAERNAQRSAANIKHDYPIDNWQAPSGTNNNGKSSAASDAQPPKGLTNDVKVEKCVEGPSVGKT